MVSNLDRRLNALEQQQPPMDWRTYAAHHGLSEREVALEAQRILAEEDHGFDAGTVESARDIIQSILREEAANAN